MSSDTDVDRYWLPVLSSVPSTMARKDVLQLLAKTDLAFRRKHQPAQYMKIIHVLRPNGTFRQSAGEIATAMCAYPDSLVVDRLLHGPVTFTKRQVAKLRRAVWKKSKSKSKSLSSLIAAAV